MFCDLRKLKQPEGTRMRFHYCFTIYKVLIDSEKVDILKTENLLLKKRNFFRNLSPTDVFSLKFF